MTRRVSTQWHKMNASPASQVFVRRAILGREEHVAVLRAVYECMRACFGRQDMCIGGQEADMRSYLIPVTKEAEDDRVRC